MTVISASLVSELRQLTGCGMMECKKALEEAQGDLNKAQEVLRKKGMAKATNKAHRATSEGVIKIKVNSNHREAVMLEINCETDFVARDENFKKFVDQISDMALTQSLQDVQQLTTAIGSNGKTADQMRQELISKIGENINMTRMVRLVSGDQLGYYEHGGRLGALVAIKGGDAELAKDLAMHIVASHPRVIYPEELAAEIINKEKEIYRAQAMTSGKPENVIGKMVEGRLQKFLNEVSLVKQPFVKNPEIAVEKLLAEKKATVTQFIRFELGETL